MFLWRMRGPLWDPGRTVPFGKILQLQVSCSHLGFGLACCAAFCDWGGGWLLLLAASWGLYLAALEVGMACVRRDDP